MMLLVSGATRTVKKWKRVGELIVPAAGNSPDMLKLLPGMWAMDNGVLFRPRYGSLCSDVGAIPRSAWVSLGGRAG